MQPRAVDFVTYGVSSLKTALPFYRDVLGLKPSGPPYEGVWQEFQLGPVTLAIGAPPFGQPPKEGYTGGATVAIAVEDIHRTVRELKERGVAVAQEPMETPVCHMAAIKDPDGNTILLHERKDGTAG